MGLPLSGIEWLAATAVIVAGTVLQGSIGFGVALVGAPLLYLVEPALIPAPMIIVGMSVPALILWRERRAVAAADVAAVLPGTVMGVLLAWATLSVVSERALGLLFGVLVLLAVTLSLWRRLPVRGPALLAAAGGLSGFMATTTSIGGPPLALAFQDRSGPGLRGTLSACFVPLGLLALAALYGAGRLGAAELVAGLGLLPAVVVGFAISARTARALDRHWLRAAVLAVSAAAGAAAIVRALA